MNAYTNYYCSVHGMIEIPIFNICPWCGKQLTWIKYIYYYPMGTNISQEISV